MMTEDDMNRVAMEPFVNDLKDLSSENAERELNAVQHSIDEDTA